MVIWWICKNNIKFVIACFYKLKYITFDDTKIVGIEFRNNGFNEICLTGVDICSYEPSFSGLVRYILEQIPNLPTLTFGSLDPAAIDD